MDITPDVGHGDLVVGLGAWRFVHGVKLRVTAYIERLIVGQCYVKQFLRRMFESSPKSFQV